MAAEGLIDFEELRTQLAALEETRKTAEQELQALQPDPLVPRATYFFYDGYMEGQLSSGGITEDLDGSL